MANFVSHVSLVWASHAAAGCSPPKHSSNTHAARTLFWRCQISRVEINLREDAFGIQYIMRIRYRSFLSLLRYIFFSFSFLSPIIGGNEERDFFLFFFW